MDHDNELEQLEKNTQVRALLDMLEKARTPIPLEAPPGFRRAVLAQLPQSPTFFGFGKTWLDWFAHQPPLNRLSPLAIATVLCVFLSGAAAYALLTPFVPDKLYTLYTWIFFFQSAPSFDSAESTEPPHEGQQQTHVSQAPDEVLSTISEGPISLDLAEDVPPGEESVGELGTGGSEPEGRQDGIAVKRNDSNQATHLSEDEAHDAPLVLTAPAAPTVPMEICLPDALRSGNVCVDKFRASVWIIPPSERNFRSYQIRLRQLAKRGEVSFDDLTELGALQVGDTMDNYGADCPDDGNATGCLNIFAVSLPGVKPSRFITEQQASRACENSGKRLWIWRPLNRTAGFQCIR